jgi:glycosyltransferase involved in cell wall biosynthesis
MKNQKNNNLNIQIFHDNFIFYGGAEKICKFISRSLKIKLVTSLKNNFLKIFFFNLLIKNLYSFFYFFFLQNIKNLFNFYYFKFTIFSSNFSIFGSFFLRKKILYLHHLPKFAFDKSYSLFLILKIFIFFYKKFFYYFINNLDLIIFNSNYTRDLFHKNCNLNKKTKEMVLYPFSSGNIKNRPKINGPIICVSRYSRNKNIDLFIKIAKKIENKKFVLITSNNIYSFYKNNELKKIKNLKIYINQKKLKKFYEKAFYSLFLGEKEDYGMFVAESLRYNLPVLCIKSGNSSNMIKDKINGFLLSKNALQIEKKIRSISNKEVIKISKKIKINKFDFLNSKEDFIFNLKKGIEQIN